MMNMKEFKQEFIKFRAKYRNFMNTQLETFDDLEKDFIKNYNVSEPIEEDELCEKEASVSMDENEKDRDDASKETFNEDLNEIKSFFVNE